MLAFLFLLNPNLTAQAHLMVFLSQLVQYDLRFTFYRNSFVADSPSYGKAENGVYPCLL